MKKELIPIAKALLTMQRQSWEQGVAAQAFFECGDPDTGVLLVREALHRGDAHGLLGITNRAADSVDCGANGLPAYYAYRHTGDPAFLRAAQRLADWFEFSAPRSPTGQLYHNPNTRRNMIDGIYHIVPVLMVTGHVDFAMKQLKLFHARHFDPQSGLYRQFWDDDAGSFCRRDLWGGGQGWMACALALACLHLPKDRPQDFSWTQKTLKDLLASMEKHLTPDCMFHDVVDDPATFPECTASLMLCYAISVGLRAGAVPERYRALAGEILESVGRHVDGDGYVRDVCSSPYFDRPGRSAEAQAFYMLCTAALEEN